LKLKNSYLLKVLLIWGGCVAAYFLLWEGGLTIYEYTQKTALPRHLLKQFYLVHGLIGVVGFSCAAIYLFYGKQKELQRDQLKDSQVKILEKFSSHVAHEIRNPLTSLSLNTELIQQNIGHLESGKTEELKNLSEAVSKDVTRLSKTTEAYLNFRNHIPKNEKFNMDDVLESLVSSLKPTLQAQDVQTRFQLQCAPKIELQGDSKRFQSAIRLLIENSLEAMPQGGDITLKGDRKRQFCELTLSDTGVGMTRDVEEQLFEPFFTTKLKGTGLGLALVRQILMEFQATIKCRTAVGKGTTFQIRVPLVKSLSNNGVNS